jgi:hypothetical protein
MSGVQVRPKEERFKGLFPSSAKSERTSRTRRPRRPVVLKFIFFKEVRLQPMSVWRAFWNSSTLRVLNRWPSLYFVLRISSKVKSEFASVRNLKKMSFKGTYIRQGRK